MSSDFESTRSAGKGNCSPSNLGFLSLLPVAVSLHVWPRGPSPDLWRVCEPQDSLVNLNISGRGFIFQEQDQILKVSPLRVKTPGLLQLPHFIRGPVAQGWASLMAQMVKNPPELGDTWVAKIPMATHSIILSWRIPMDRGVWWAAKSQTRLSN